MRPLNSCLGFVSVSWRLVHNLLDVKIVFAGTFKGLTDDILVHELTRIPLKSTAHSFTSVWVFDGVVDTMWPVGLLCLLDPPPPPPLVFAFITNGGQSSIRDHPAHLAVCLLLPLVPDNNSMCVKHL